MVKLSLIPKVSLENHEKCETCVESKTTKKSCKSINKVLELLNLIHSDLGDLKSTMTRGGKCFYITFIKYKNEVENQLSKKIKRLRTYRA